MKSLSPYLENARRGLKIHCGPLAPYAIRVFAKIKSRAAITSLLDSAAEGSLAHFGFMATPIGEYVVFFCFKNG